jgi:hypothetical protein
LKAQGFKTTNLLLHIVISALSLRVFDRLFGGGCPRASLVSALIFAVHPIHCEAVSNFLFKSNNGKIKKKKKKIRTIPQA